jgi:ribonuclease III
MEADAKELEAALGHAFARPELLVRALTHRSLAKQRTQEEAAEEGAAAGETSGWSFWATRC